MSGHRPIGRPRPAVRRSTKGIKSGFVGVDTAKDAIYSRLRIKEAGPGYCHFPMSYG